MTPASIIAMVVGIVGVACLVGFIRFFLPRGVDGGKRMRRKELLRLLDGLRDAFGFSVVRSVLTHENYAEGRLGGYRALVLAMPPRSSADEIPDDGADAAPDERLAAPAEDCLVIRLKGRCFPRKAMEIAKTAAPMKARDEGGERAWSNSVSRGRRVSGRVRLDPDDLPAVNGLLGREVFTRTMLKDVRFIAGAACGFSVRSGELAVGLPFRSATAASVRRLIETAAGFAGRLAEAGAKCDLYLPAVCLELRRTADRRRRLALLRLLTAGYRGEPLARRTCEGFIADPDFAIAFEAAQCLTLDAYRFITDRYETFDFTNRALALGALCALPGRAPAEYVSGIFAKTDSPMLKKTVIDAYRDCRDGRGRAVFLAGADDPAPEVRLTAAEALIEQGDARSLGVLYRLSRDARLPEELRARLAEAIDIVKGNATEAELGLLSLVDGEEAEGGLSKADGETHESNHRKN